MEETRQDRRVRTGQQRWVRMVHHMSATPFMYTTLLAAPTSMNWPALHREAQRPGDDINGTQIRCVMEKKVPSMLMKV